VIFINHEEQIIELHKKNINSYEIANILKIKRQTVYECLKENNLKSHNKKPLKPRKIKEEDISKAIDLYYQGYSINKIIEELKLDCSSSALRGLFIRRNVKLRRRGKQSNFNECYFEKIDNPHKAYWLGFIYADGNITNNRLRIEVHKKDIEIIHNILIDLQSDNKIITDNSISDFGKKNNVAIGFCSDKMKCDLEKYGVIENKTHKLEKIPDIPKNLIRHFIRGYFDGDGTVYLNNKSKSLRFGFYGTYKLLENIKLHLYEELGLSTNKLYEKAGCWLLSYSKKEDINKFYNYIYSDIDIFLTRKKKKFDDNIC
jgi:intein-encoded DNA endonuclease-like protein